MTLFSYRPKKAGYTLIELIIAIGLFALVMTLASGAYLFMISINRQVQGTATGIDNLSFALEDMTRSIRTGGTYSCNGSGNCSGGGNSFSFTDSNGVMITYDLAGSTLRKTKGGVSSTLTDPKVVISSLLFYADGTARAPGDYEQAHVTIVVSGTVAAGPGKTVPFTVETAATMRGSDL